MSIKLLPSLALLCFLVSPLIAQDSPTQNDWPIGSQTEESFKTSDAAEVGYLLSVPKADADETGRPLMLFLHGRGESRGPLSLVAKWGPPKMIADGKQLPYVLVSPQCPAEDEWSSPTQQARLAELLGYLIEKHAIDKNRVYLTGLSMGGHGTWKLASNHLDLFAAVVPVCGRCDPQWAENLKDIPIWVFHGNDDSVIPLSESVEMVDAIKALGGSSIRFTTLEHIGHNSWSSTYATPELFSWIDSQQRQ